MPFKKVFFILAIVASLFIIYNLAYSIYTLWSKKQLVLNMKNEAETKRDDNLELKRKLSLIEKPQFIEEEARNKLFLAKPGDAVILLSDKDLKASEAAKPKPPDHRPNWRKWWDVFFKPEA